MKKTWIDRVAKPEVKRHPNIDLRAKKIDREKEFRK